MKKIGLFGCGKLNTIVAECYMKGLLPGYEIVSCYSKSLESKERLAKFLNIRAANSIDEFLDSGLDYICEATNPNATKEILDKAIINRISVILLSIGVLADKDYYNYIDRLTREYQTKIYLASGAISGFEVLRAAQIMGLTRAKLTNLKGTEGVQRLSSLYTKEMDEPGWHNVFSGTAIDAINNLPCGMNVGVATALATMGIEKTEIEIKAEPSFIGDSQCIDIECGDELKCHLDVYSKTPAVAGYSVVALLRNLNSFIVF